MVRVPMSATFVVAAMAGHPDYDDMWNNFRADYGRVYNGDDSDERFMIFKTNVDRILQINSEDLPYKYAINQFTDMTSDEIPKGRSGTQMYGDLAHLGTHVEVESSVSQIDWSQQGAVTPVKDQGGCGSCWAFGTTGSLESAWYLAGNGLPELSEQQFLDCDTSYNSGCGGGLETYAIQYAVANGVCSSSSYSYSGRQGSCRASSCSKVVPAGGFTGYRYVASSVSAVQSALNQQPLNIGVAADSWSSYGSGILSNCGGQIDHAVLLVGYGSNYWKVKNSWGSAWGEFGYIRLTTSGNPCSLLSDAHYPVASGSPSPSPTPTPSPSPTPTPSPTGYYGRPPWCVSGEIVADLGVSQVCAAQCFPDSNCPPSPPETYYAASCGALSDGNGNTYCGIPCDDSSDCQSGASCDQSLCSFATSSATEDSIKTFHTSKPQEAMKKRNNLVV